MHARQLKNAFLCSMYILQVAGCRSKWAVYSNIRLTASNLSWFRLTGVLCRLTETQKLIFQPAKYTCQFFWANSGDPKIVDLKLVFISNHHLSAKFISMKVPWYMKLKGRQRYFVLPEIYSVFNWRRATRNRLCSSNKLFFVRLQYLSSRRS